MKKPKFLFPCTLSGPSVETSRPRASKLGNSLKKPFQLLLVFLGCLHLVGGPYSILQGCAWVNMLISYSQKDGLVKAAKDTFSGEKPCKLCCKIAEAREVDSKNPGDPVKPPLSPVAAKLLHEMLPSSVTAIEPPAAIDFPSPSLPGVHLSAGCAKASPPVPPPCRAA
ncbi:MAG TPA: hypothetical protein VM511_01800 [Luteolibacter sp.]|nr:hypothetical protein [Luteolibacter sp.]